MPSSSRFLMLALTVFCAVFTRTSGQEVNNLSEITASENASANTETMLNTADTSMGIDSITSTNITLPEQEVQAPLFDAEEDRVVVTLQAMGARCAVAADFDGDGRMDLVSASSNDNAVSWFRNLGPQEDGSVAFGIKEQITWNSLGSRIVTVADLNGDGAVDVVGASYYDSSLRWFENDGTGKFTPHLISDGVNEGQGVTVADVDHDGDADIITASSGDNTIAVFKNMDKGKFCQVKEIVDDNAMGARTVVAADLNGDGWIDLASASKDDDTVAWYPNDGTGHFPTKIIISAGPESTGAYSLVAVDIDNDGDQDLIVASNGNDHVSLWRNNGQGNFTKTLVYDNADFVLSVTAVDFDRDGDMDIASASFFDGHINWYENVDGEGYVWKNHTIYVGIQGHYVAYGDMDGDGDDDLIAVTHADNTVAVFLARTECDLAGDPSSHFNQECCHSGTAWNGTACDPCGEGTYGVGHGRDARCEPCPTDACVIPGLNLLPATCSGYTGCVDVEASVAACACPVDTMKDHITDACIPCSDGTIRPDHHGVHRGVESIDNYTLWEEQQGICFIPEVEDMTTMIVLMAALGAVALIGGLWVLHRQQALAKADAMWTINEKDITYDDPVAVLGNGSFGEVFKGYYRGTTVAVKRALPMPMSSAGSGTRTKSALTVPPGSQDGSVEDQRPGTVSMMQSTRQVFRNSNENPKIRTTLKSMTRKQMQDSFIQEMRILSKLRHPCITTVMGAVLGKRPLLVMEFMENGSLRDLLSNKTFPLDPELTLPLIRDVLQGIRFLHSAIPPIVHGDLKASNVLVDANFRAKIADFGLSARCTAVGTPYYMAPELLRGSPITTQSDVYSFGVLLWEVMTHKVPYEEIDDLSHEEIIELVAEGKLRPDCQEGLDRELVQCMEECWAQEPGKRPTLEELEMKLIPLCGQNLFLVMQERNKDAKKQSSLLQDVFPEHITKALLAGKKVTPEPHDCVTIYFSDIVGFTRISSMLSAAQVSDLLDRLYTLFDSLAEKHGVFKLETIGDSWVGVTNLTRKQADHAARIARFSIDAVQTALATPVHPDRPELGNVKIRVGFHSGPVVASVVGTRNPRYCLFGDSMNTASRMESGSEPLRIQCSDAAAQLVKAQDKSLKFSYRGKVKVKGKDFMKTHWLQGGDIDHNSHECEGSESEVGVLDEAMGKYLQKFDQAPEEAAPESAPEMHSEMAVEPSSHGKKNNKELSRSGHGSKKVLEEDPINVARKKYLQQRIKEAMGRA
uniref:guanylate cyclase n=1 Tax=Amphora coffeiformis TaxID=265554 RepID=A0A6S8IT67_9STRA|mmetsp:Transcript_25230/g.47882  ORF Transcript_25230/g.47882 Transcript_25230/m.47882 type:complete len:1254 (-) Transcript_25230:819-4580(-)